MPVDTTLEFIDESHKQRYAEYVEQIDNLLEQIKAIYPKAKIMEPQYGWKSLEYYLRQGVATITIKLKGNASSDSYSKGPLYRGSWDSKIRTTANYKTHIEVSFDYSSGARTRNFPQKKDGTFSLDKMQTAISEAESFAASRLARAAQESNVYRTNHQLTECGRDSVTGLAVTASSHKLNSFDINCSDVTAEQIEKIKVILGEKA